MSKRGAHKVLTTKDLSIGYGSKKEIKVIAKHMDLTLNKGELVCLVGKNGIGKSTLLRTLSKMQPRLDGNIFLEDKSIDLFSRNELAKIISLVLTERIPSSNLTVYELIALGRQPYTNWIGKLLEEDLIQIKEAMSQSHLTELMHERCDKLSDGQLQRAMICRALAQNTDLIILDEPTAHLDVQHKMETFKLLKKIAHELNRAILISTHEIQLATQIADELWLMTEEKIITGTPSALIESDQINLLFDSNFMSFDRQWQEKVGSEDSHARAVWALGTALWRSQNKGHRKLCNELFDQALPAIENFTSPRAWAFGLIGIHEYFRRFEGDLEVSRIREVLTEKLLILWRDAHAPEWPWLEDIVCYDNMRIAHALILSGYWIPNEEAFEAGLTGLRWLIGLQTAPEGHFRPIGCNGFLHRGKGPPAQFDQQPLEACAMISASLEAFRMTKDPYFSHAAQISFEWFLGRNDLGLPLYDPATGGCQDALHQDRINENQGAESSLSFYLSIAEMRLSQNLIQYPQSL